MLQNLTVLQMGFVLVSLLIAMSVHEAMHAFTSHWLGDTTAEEQGRLTLNPLKHIDPVMTVLLPAISFILFRIPVMAAKPVPFNPNRVRHEEFGVALVGIAGPLTNLVLAGISSMLFRLIPGYSNNFSDFLVIFTLINIGLFIFNMIPFPPLDGSRVLYAFAPEPLQRVMQTIEGFGFSAILFFIFFLYQFIGPTIGQLNDSLMRLLLGVN